MNNNPALSNDKFTRIKYAMLHVKSKVRLSRIGDNENLLKLRYDCAISIVSQVVVEGMKKKRDTTKTWYLGRVYRVCHKIGNRWIEYGQPINLWDWPSNMEMELCWS